MSEPQKAFTKGIRYETHKNRKVMFNPDEHSDNPVMINNEAPSVDLSHIELLPCGHQNNLKLVGRRPGICPKGDEPVV